MERRLAVRAVRCNQSLHNLAQSFVPAMPMRVNLPADPPTERRLFALGLRLFGVSCLSIMTIFIKLAGDHGIPTSEMMFWRQAFALPVVLAFVVATSGLPSLRTAHFGLHASRTVFGLIAMGFTFSSYLILPLAEATTIGFTVPLFATLLSALILRERTGLHRWGAVIGGFVGVLIVVQPGSGHIPAAGAAVGLTSAFMIGCMTLLLRQIGKTETAATTVFYFSALSVPILAPFLWLYGSAHDGEGWLLMLAIGTIGGVGQIAFTASLRWAPIATVVGMDYISLLWSTLFGFLVWNHFPSAATWLGAPIIIASGLYIAWREHRLSIERNRDFVA
jgi:drug/metabolite transporter (DMT)-like permease